jgi:hypothetical protein
MTSSNFNFLFQVSNCQSYWINNGQSSGSSKIELFPEYILQEMERNNVFISPPGDSDAVTELIDCLSSVSSPPEAVECEYPGIVPALHVAFEN